MVTCWNCRFEVAEESASVMVVFEGHTLCPECLVQQQFESAGFKVLGDEMVLKCPTDPVHSFVVYYNQFEDAWYGFLRIDSSGETDGMAAQYDGWDFAFSDALALGFTEPVLER